MHPSELKTHSTLVICVIKEYELKQGPLRPIRLYRLTQNPILKLN